MLKETQKDLKSMNLNDYQEKDNNIDIKVNNENIIFDNKLKNNDNLIESNQN